MHLVEKNNYKLVLPKSIALVMSVFYFGISDFSRALAQIGISRVISYIIYLIVLVLFVLKYINKVRFFDLIYYIVVIVLSTYGILNYGNQYMGEMNKYAMIILFIPGYYYFRMCDDDSKYDGLIIANAFSSVYLLLYYFVFLFRTSGYDMNYAYWIATPLCVNVYLFISTKKKMCLALSVIMFITLVMSGSRGALGLTMLCVAFIIIQNTNNKKLALLLLFIVALFVVISIWGTDFIYSFLSKFSGSRNIRKLLSGTYMESSTRDHIYSMCKTFIRNNPYGYGTLASRELLSGYSYPHSVYYELQIDYGRIPGILLTGMVYGMGVFNLITYRKSKIQVIVATTEIIGLGSLLVSSSLYHSAVVPATMALFINSLLHIRQNRKESELNARKESN